VLKVPYFEPRRTFTCAFSATRLCGYLICPRVQLFIDLLTSTLQNGFKEFDRSANFNFRLGVGEVIKGWDEGCKGMREGGVRRLLVPSHLGYGRQGAGKDIPPNADLVFEVTLKRVL
jgi:hypothetical protein